MDIDYVLKLVKNAFANITEEIANEHYSCYASNEEINNYETRFFNNTDLEVCIKSISITKEN